MALTREVRLQHKVTESRRCEENVDSARNNFIGIVVNDQNNVCRQHVRESYGEITTRPQTGCYRRPAHSKCNSSPQHCFDIKGSLKRIIKQLFVTKCHIDPPVI